MGIKYKPTNIKEKLDKFSFSKHYVHCLQPICIMPKVGTITYSMNTDNIVKLQLKISGYTACTRNKGKIEETMFLEGYTAYLHKGVGGRVMRWPWVNFNCRGVLQFG